MILYQYSGHCWWIGVKSLTIICPGLRTTVHDWRNDPPCIRHEAAFFIVTQDYAGVRKFHPSLGDNITLICSLNVQLRFVTSSSPKKWHVNPGWCQENQTKPGMYQPRVVLELIFSGSTWPEGVLKRSGELLNPHPRTSRADKGSICPQVRLRDEEEESFKEKLEMS